MQVGLPVSVLWLFRCLIHHSAKTAHVDADAFWLRT